MRGKKGRNDRSGRRKKGRRAKEGQVGFGKGTESSEEQEEAGSRRF